MGVSARQGVDISIMSTICAVRYGWPLLDTCVSHSRKMSFVCLWHWWFYSQCIANCDIEKWKYWS